MSANDGTATKSHTTSTTVDHLLDYEDEDYDANDLEVCFDDCEKTLGDVFRNGPMTFSEMNERLWDFLWREGIITIKKPKPHLQD